MERPLAGALSAPARDHAMKVLLINPNTNTETTAMMLAVARGAAPAHWDWATLTAKDGSALIDHREALDFAAVQVAAMASHIPAMQVDAVIVAAFGDPGLPALRDSLAVPVVGIGEAAMRAADARGLPFSILTITPQLRESTLAQVARYGCGKHFQSLIVTTDDAAATARDPAALVARIKTSIHRAIHEDGAKVLVIGGGPVTAAAQELGQSIDAIVVQPLVAAIEQLQAMAELANPIHVS